MAINCAFYGPARETKKRRAFVFFAVYVILFFLSLSASEGADKYNPCPRTKTKEELESYEAQWGDTIQGELRRKSSEYTGYANTNLRQAGREWLASEDQGIKYFHGNLYDNYCLEIYYDVMTLLRAIKAGANLVESMVLAVMKAVLAYVCDMVVTATQNVLQAICIPMPDLTFGLDFEKLSLTSCNGLSLGSIVSVSEMPIKIPQIPEGGSGMYMYNYIMQGIKDPNTGKIKY